LFLIPRKIKYDIKVHYILLSILKNDKPVVKKLCPFMTGFFLT